MAKHKTPKFQPGDAVEYPEDYDGRWEAGTGTIKGICPGNGGGVPFHYEVKTADGEVLPVSFPEGELKLKK